MILSSPAWTDDFTPMGGHGLSQLSIATKVLGLSPVVPTFLGSGPGFKVGPKKANIEANLILIEDPKGEKLLIISIDTLYVGHDLVCEIRQAVNAWIRPESVVVAASHTHNSPMLDGSKPSLGQVVPEHFDAVRDLILRESVAIFSAKKICVDVIAKQYDVSRSVSRRRAILPILAGKNGLKILRANFFPSPVNQIVLSEIIEFRTSSEELIACIWVMPCHPVSLPSESEITAGFVGEIREECRRRESLGKSVAFCFLQGASGDLRPPSFKADPAIKVRALKSMVSWINKPHFGNGYGPFSREGYKEWVLELTNGFFSAAETSGWQAKGEARLHSERESVPLEQFYRGQDIERRVVEYQKFKIQGLRFLALSAEPTSAVGNKLRALAKNSTVVGCTADTFGYLSSPWEELFGGYEVRGFEKAFSMKRRFSLIPLFCRLQRGLGFRNSSF